MGGDPSPGIMSTMRGQGMHMALIGRTGTLLLVLLALTLSLSVLVVEAGILIISDDFEGVDGDWPDSDKWMVHYWDSNDEVRIEDGMLRATNPSGGRTYIYCRDYFYSKNFTILLDWVPIVVNGRALDLRVVSQWGVYIREFVCLNYDGDTYGWTLGYRLNNDWFPTYTYDLNVEEGTLYGVNMTYRVDTVTVSVWEQATGDLLFTKTQVTDPLWMPCNIRLGVTSSMSQFSPDAYFDNLRIFSEDAIPAPLPLLPEDGALLNHTPELTWSVLHLPPVELSTFQVQVTDDVGKPEPTLDSGTVDSEDTSYTLQDLPSGTWYWRVRVGTNDGHWSLWSTYHSFVLDTTAPPRVGRPVDEGERTNVTSLTWDWNAVDDASGIVGYFIQGGTTPDANDLFEEVFVEGTTHTWNGARNGSTYYCAVRALDGAGNLGPVSEPSDGILVSLDGPSGNGVVEISPPILLLPRNGALLNHIPQLQWAVPYMPSVQLGTFQVQVTDDLEDPGHTMDSGPVDSGGPPYTLQDIPSGRWYWCVRVGTDDGLWSPWSSYHSFVLDTIPPPRVGRPVDGGERTNVTSVTWDWQAVADASGIAGYYIQVGTTPQANDLLEEVFVEGTTFTLSGAMNGTMYYAAVWALDRAGNLGPISEPSDGILVSLDVPTGNGGNGNGGNGSDIVKPVEDPWFVSAPVTGLMLVLVCVMVGLVAYLYLKARQPPEWDR